MQSQVASDDEKNLFFFMLCEIYENSKSYASLIRFPHVTSMIPPSTMWESHLRVYIWTQLDTMYNYNLYRLNLF